MFKTQTPIINKAITSASNPDLTLKERRELRRQLRFYIAVDGMAESVVKRCHIALQQVLDVIPWYLNPWFVGLTCSTLFFVIGFLSK